MSKKEFIKKKELFFFELVFYKYLYYFFLIVTLIGLIIVYFLDSTDAINYIINTIFYIIYPAIICWALSYIKKARAKELSLKVKINTKGIVYNETDVKYEAINNNLDSVSSFYKDMCLKFDKMTSSELQLIVTSRRKNEEQRSAVGYYIDSVITQLNKEICPVVYSNMEVPMLLDTEGYPFYLFPHFVIHVKDSKNIVAFSYNDFQLTISHSSYIVGNEDHMPTDTQIKGRAYDYSNKDGSPDLRVKDNPFRYIIYTIALISEEHNIYYELSNVEATEAFFSSYKEFTNSLWFK